MILQSLVLDNSFPESTGVMLKILHVSLSKLRILLSFELRILYPFPRCVWIGNVDAQIGAAIKHIYTVR